MMKRYSVRNAKGRFVRKPVQTMPLYIRLPILAMVVLISLLLLAGCGYSKMPTVTGQASNDIGCDAVNELPEKATYRQLAAAYVELVGQYQSCADR